MEKFIEKNDFYRFDWFLMKLYHELEVKLKGEQIKYLKEGILEQNKSKRFMIKIEELQKAKEVCNKINPNVVTILYHWHNLAREVVYFKKLVESIKESSKKDLCENCYEAKNLKIIERESISKMFHKYKTWLSGTVHHKNTWIKFYR